MTYRLTVIADTRDRFADFRPYVASVNGHASVAFQATLRDGRTGVFVADGDTIRDVVISDELSIRELRSHPDLDDEGRVSVYAELGDGRDAVLLVGLETKILASTERFSCIGPLGPTMNERGVVAYRATTHQGARGIFTGDGDRIVTHADTTRFDELRGLPLVCGDGSVLFRADEGGHPRIVRSRDGALEILVDGFRALGAFPAANGRGDVVFSGVRSDGTPGVFSMSSTGLRAIVEGSDTFESYRGAVVADDGVVVFYATPRGGRLGLYRVAGAGIERVLSLGDGMFDSEVVDLAFNPVSMSAAGVCAIRLELANGLQVIVRADLA